MSQTATLHIKVEPSVAKGLKDVARQREVTVGELVRQAVQSCYQVDLFGLTAVQRQAVEAYKGGYISHGKLAEAMGLTPLRLRKWLHEHGVIQNTAYQKEDMTYA